MKLSFVNNRVSESIIPAVRNASLLKKAIGTFSDQISFILFSSESKAEKIKEGARFVLSVPVVFLPRWIVLIWMGPQLGIPVCVLGEMVRILPENSELKTPLFIKLNTYTGLDYFLKQRAIFHKSLRSELFIVCGRGFMNIGKILGEYKNDGEYPIGSKKDIYVLGKK